MTKNVSELTVDDFNSEDSKNLFRRLQLSENSFLKMAESVRELVYVMSGSLTSINRRIDRLSEKVDKVSSQLKMETDNLNTRIDQINKDIKTLDDKVDDLEEYLKDTLSTMAEDFSQKYNESTANIAKANTKIEIIANYLNIAFDDEGLIAGIQ